MPSVHVAQGEGSTFRPEIEGVRALAALLVAIFHIWVRHPSGGVDVFFVVSGFLITTGLLKQVERTGHVQFARFWARLIKRLWPPALLVLGVVVIASILLLPKSRWRETIVDVAAAAAYVENWRQAQHATFTPVLHYWALSTQGQFYVLWPLLMAAVVWIARRAGFGFRTTLTVALATVFAVSLAYSIVLTAQDQYFAYNNTFARMWEFGIGGLLATQIERIRLPLAARVTAGWVGVIAIATCGALLPVATAFPGYMALWPALAGALVIVAGTTGSPFGADRLLASRPMVFLGSISYSLYLWHYPILIFCDRLLSPKTLTFMQGVAILAASLVLAWLTARLVETPIRRSNIGKQYPSRAFALGAAAMAPIVIGLALWAVAYHQARERERLLVASVRHLPGALALESGFRYRAERDVPIVPGPLSVAEDREYLRAEKCGAGGSSTEPPLCSVGVPNGTYTLVLVGGSHSAQWLPALRTIARESHWSLFTFARTSCPFDRSETVHGDEASNADCQRWTESVIRQIQGLHPDAVLTSATHLTDEGDEIVPPGYIRAWQELARSGIRVIALRHNPSFGFDTTACVELHGAGSPECTMPRAELLKEPSPVERLGPLPWNVRFLDLSDYFCDARLCYPVVGNVMVYRNLNHLTATYARTLAPVLRREIVRIFANAPRTPAPVAPLPLTRPMG